MIYHGSTPVTEVILHTAATPGDWWKGKTVEMVIQEIDRWHRARGFKMIGYHRVFMPNGDMGMGRSIYQMGAHVAGRNRGTIGLCMIPIKTHDGVTKFEDYFTEYQRAAVLDYIEALGELTDIKKVSGHNDYAPKECPGFKVKSGDWLR